MKSVEWIDNKELTLEQFKLYQYKNTALPLKNRIAVSAINHQLDKKIPTPTARAVLQYVLGCSNKLPLPISKELRVQSLASLGSNFLDIIGKEVVDLVAPELQEIVKQYPKSKEIPAPQQEEIPLLIETLYESR